MFDKPQDGHGFGHEASDPCDAPLQEKPRRTIGDIASSPRCGDEVRLFAGLVVYQVERVDGEVPGYHWRVICRREETPPSGSTRTVSHSTWPSLQPSTWADVCRAACSWEPAP